MSSVLTEAATLKTQPLCQVMSAISSSFSFTQLTYLAGLLCEFLLVLVTEFFVLSSSSSVHLPRSFAVLIQFLLIWLLLSVRCSVSSSICLRNSLMSSSHLFLGLPTDLLVLYFELISGFHSAALINQFCFYDVAILIANLHFIFL